MAKFINFEAEHSGSEENAKNESDFSEVNSFINDKSEDDENYGFANVQVDLEDANMEAMQRGLERIENCDEYSNLCADSEEDEAPDCLIEEFKKELTTKNLFTIILLESFCTQ